jgi:phage-related baseplate assembly protein
VSDVADFGVTPTGFTVKGFDVVLREHIERARQAFGANVDLSATSPLLKILQVVAAEDAEQWKRMEDLYYSNFVSTAIGDALDLLGEDVGLPRRQLFAEGEVQLTINNAAPGRQYVLPEGTVVVTAAPVRAFYTTGPVSLSAAAPQSTVRARAFDRGVGGNIAAGQITGLDPVYVTVYLGNLGPASIAAANPQPFAGGNVLEADEVYRTRLLGLPRTIWTLESARRAVLDVSGVIDVLLFDPLGGVDVSQSYFNLFEFGERAFSGERRLGEPYFFDVVVAHEFAWPWRTQGPVPGIFERVTAAVDRVRPVGIHPHIVQANHIDVGVQATVLVGPGYDREALLAAIKQRLAQDIGGLKLGGDVLYSQVMCAFVEQVGVVDVQNLRLRRCPAGFGRISFGAVPFQSAVIEAAPGENLAMAAIEIAVFRIDSELIDIEVVER